jgi:hypothetical protein
LITEDFQSVFYSMRLDYRGSEMIRSHLPDGVKIGTAISAVQ